MRLKILRWSRGSFAIIFFNHKMRRGRNSWMTWALNNNWTTLFA